MENAKRYAPDSAPRVTFSKSDRGVNITVEDRGPGIEEADRERIFEPLLRLDRARTIGNAADGFGLGLTVARSITRSFGGDLACRARSDGQAGAAFVFDFPQQIETNANKTA